MKGELEDTETVKEIVTDYAAENCVGQLGEIGDIEREDGVWTVEFRTHTFSNTYDHRVRVSPVGNVFVHEQEKRSD